MGWFKLIIKAIGRAFVKIGMKKSIGPYRRLVDIADVAVDISSGNIASGMVGTFTTVADVATYGVIGDMGTLTRTIREAVTANMVATNACELVRSV